MPRSQPPRHRRVGAPRHGPTAEALPPAPADRIERAEAAVARVADRAGGAIPAADIPLQQAVARLAVGAARTGWR